MVAIRRRQLKNMAVPIVGTRIGGIDLLGLACRVLGQHHVNLAGLGIGFDVFRPVELGRTQKIGRAPRLDDHIGLAVELVGRVEGALSEYERQPLHRAVRTEPGDRKHAAVEDVIVGGFVPGVDLCAGDEPVAIVVDLVVAGINHILPATRIDDACRALVLETPERRAFFRNAVGIERIDFNNPAEAV